MRLICSASTALALAFAAATVAAEPRTVTLEVKGMYCAVCPLTVKTALKKVPGVLGASASFDTKSATVTYDDAKTSVERLVKATGDAGFPSAARRP